MCASAVICPGVGEVLKRRDPGRFVYAPNYWQWFAHHRDHGTLPPVLRECGSQLGMIRALDLEVFSRNLYCDERRGWFGGLCDYVWDDPVRSEIRGAQSGADLVWNKTYSTPAGPLKEELRFAGDETTLEQKRFLVTDYEEQGDAFELWLKYRRLEFDAVRWSEESARAGGGVICAGEVTSPLKMLHLAMGPEKTVFLLMDEPKRAERWMWIHHEQQMAAMRQMLEAGVPAVMSMDNLDTQFHPPHYVERFCAAYYEEAAALCHQYGATFWIHACGQQRDNLELISSLGVDGLEGVAFPPMGNVTLPEVFELAGDRFLITGGISAIEYETLNTRDAVFDYIHNLFAELAPCRNRFMLSASCNTPINARWEQIVWFRDAWREFGGA